MTRAKVALDPELDVDLRLALNKAIRQNPLVLSADAVLALIAPVIDRFVREAKAAELRGLGSFLSDMHESLTAEFWDHTRNGDGPAAAEHSVRATQTHRIRALVCDRADEIEGGA